jgi:hypothetical protein
MPEIKHEPVSRERLPDRIDDVAPLAAIRRELVRTRSGPVQTVTFAKKEGNSRGSDW